jgi:type IV pilus assembly protein PilW
MRGFTLVELMIATVIGLVLTIVVSSLFLHSRSTYGATDDLSRMQENIRFAQDLLSRIVHHTSYISSPNSYKDLEDAPANSSATVVFDAANAGFGATDGGTGGALGQALSDSFTVRFQGSTAAAGGADGTVSDCHGREIDGSTISVNTFTVATGANAGPALFCQAQTCIGGVCTDRGTLEVVPDVENMQVLFGIDITDALGSAARDGSVESYVPLANVTNWNKVVSVRIALLFRTPNIQSTIVPEPNRTYSLNANALGPFTDKRIRRAVTLTLSMRNRSA